MMVVLSELSAVLDLLGEAVDFFFFFFVCVVVLGRGLGLVLPLAVVVALASVVVLFFWFFLVTREGLVVRACGVVRTGTSV